MKDGGCIAIHTIATGLLSNSVDLKILTISTEKHPFDRAAFPKDFIEKTEIEAVFVDTRVNVIDAFSALVTSDSYNVSRFFSPDFDKRLIQLLQENNYDYVHLESLFMTPYISTIRSFSTAKIVLRSHNLEHLIWERIANSTANTAKKIYLKHLAAKLKKYENKTINEVDGIAAISYEDTERYKLLKCNVPLVTIPFGIDLEKYPHHSSPEANTKRLYHIGAMDWEPNKEAINWLLDDIWPAITDPTVELHLAGRKMPGYIFKLADERLLIHGEVNSAIDFMAENDILIVPLLSGSGMRVKIIEAMGMGKAVITTKIGAEGINCKHLHNIYIANTQEELIEGINYLTTHPEETKKIGKNARLLIEKEYDTKTIMTNLIAFYHTL